MKKLFALLLIVMLVLSVIPASAEDGAELLTGSGASAILPGDVNADGDVDASDASAILQHDAGVVTLSGEYLIAGDVNGDDDVDSADASAILQLDAGLIKDFAKAADNKNEQETPKEEDDQKPSELKQALGVQYIRTNGYHEELYGKYPIIVKISSVEELNSYYELNKDRYGLGRADKVYSDTTIGFLDATDKYDAEYFKDKFLLFVLLEEGSGSIRHELTGISCGEVKAEVKINRILPECGTDDMAEWHIIIELSKGIINLDYAVKVTDKNASDGKDEIKDEIIEKDEPEPVVKETSQKNIEVQYIRTNGYHEELYGKYPIIVKISSVEELNSYYEFNKDRYGLGRADKVYSDTTIGFLDATDKYDAEYFKDKFLLFVLLEEGSGSIRHELTGISYGEVRAEVKINRILPECGTADMAEWHIIIELSKELINLDYSVSQTAVHIE